MTVAVTTVVFDLGGVLLDWDPRYLYRRLLAEHEVEAFLDEIDFAGWNRGQDASARPWEDAVSELAGRHPHRRDLIAAYPQRFRETIAGPIEETVALLRELDEGGARLLALTNWSAETFAEVRGDFDFLELFEAIVVSGEEEVAKPDARLFQIMLDRFALTPSATAFVDDSAANVAVAAELGFVTLQFHGPEQLRADLVRLGLLDAPDAG